MLGFTYTVSKTPIPLTATVQHEPSESRFSSGRALHLVGLGLSRVEYVPSTILLIIVVCGSMCQP